MKIIIYNKALPWYNLLVKNSGGTYMRKIISLLLAFLLMTSFLPKPFQAATNDPLVPVYSKKYNLSMLLPKKELSRIKVVEDKEGWKFYFKETSKKVGALIVLIKKGFYTYEGEGDVYIPIIQGDKASNNVYALGPAEPMYEGSMEKEYERIYDVILKHFVTMELSTNRYVYTIPWGKTTFQKGQLGKIVVTKTTNYYTLDKNNKMIKKGTFNKGVEKPVFKPAKTQKGYYYIGGGLYVPQNSGKFVKPTSAMISNVSNEQLKTYNMTWTNMSNSKDKYYQVAEVKYLGGNKIDLAISGVIYYRNDGADVKQENLSKARVTIDSNGIGTFKFKSDFTGASGTGYIYLRNHRVAVYLVPDVLDSYFEAIDIGITYFTKKWPY